jgi:hypothetical protein
MSLQMTAIQWRWKIKTRLEIQKMEIIYWKKKTLFKQHSKDEEPIEIIGDNEQV